MTSVKLSRTYTAHNKTFDSVELREPTYKDIYMSGLGLPFDWQLSPSGQMVRIVYPEVIDAYITRLAVSPTAEYLDGLSAIDSERVVNALFGFFIDRPKTPEQPQTFSSSGSDGTPEPSAT